MIIYLDISWTALDSICSSNFGVQIAVLGLENRAEVIVG